MENKLGSPVTEDKKKPLTLADYWFHFGIVINLAVVALMVWFALS